MVDTFLASSLSRSSNYLICNSYGSKPAHSCAKLPVNGSVQICRLGCQLILVWFGSEPKLNRGNITLLSPHVIINPSCLLPNQLLFHCPRQIHSKSTPLIHAPTTTSSLNTNQPCPDPNAHTYLILIVNQPNPLNVSIISLETLSYYTLDSHNSTTLGTRLMVSMDFEGCQETSWLRGIGTRYMQSHLHQQQTRCLCCSERGWCRD